MIYCTLFIFEMLFRMWWYDMCHLGIMIIELNTDKGLCFVILINLYRNKLLFNLLDGRCAVFGYDNINSRGNRTSHGIFTNRLFFKVIFLIISACKQQWTHHLGYCHTRLANIWKLSNLLILGSSPVQAYGQDFKNQKEGIQNWLECRTKDEETVDIEQLREKIIFRSHISELSKRSAKILGN